MATARTKITREPPVRRGPIRQPGRGAPAPSTTTPRPPDDSAKGIVERNVDTAYTVIHEYMERGRVAARQQTEQSYGRDDMRSESRYNSSCSPSWDPMAPWIQWGQMMRMWIDCVSACVPCGPNARDAWSNACGGGSAWTSERCRKVEVLISSPHFATGDVDLHPGADALKLEAEPVIHKGKEFPEVAVEFEESESSSGPLYVKVTVPDEHPGGTQRFTIVDTKHGHERGTLWLEVLRDRPSPRARTV